jgi:triosephosphate isomerase (TIM)
MRKLCAGNWKMNGLKRDAVALAGALVAHAKAEMPPCDILLCPPATALASVAAALAGSPIALGGQDCSSADSGAHTGDVSAPMLKDAGCGYVILGHSERRAEHGESDAVVRAKCEAARRAGLSLIVCVGETLAERDGGKTLDVVAGQLANSLPEGLPPDELAIAYEPVWAIGTGRTPTVAQVEQVHALIRARIATKVAPAQAKDVRILYGGSVKPDNAAPFMAAKNVDGALVGGASLVSADFWAIARVCV